GDPVRGLDRHRHHLGRSPPPAPDPDHRPRLRGPVAGPCPGMACSHRRGGRPSAGSGAPRPAGPGHRRPRLAGPALRSRVRPADPPAHLLRHRLMVLRRSRRSQFLLLGPVPARRRRRHGRLGRRLGDGLTGHRPRFHRRSDLPVRRGHRPLLSFPFVLHAMALLEIATIKAGLAPGPNGVLSPEQARTGELSAASVEGGFTDAAAPGLEHDSRVSALLTRGDGEGWFWLLSIFVGTVLLAVSWPVTAGLYGVWTVT